MKNLLKTIKSFVTRFAFGSKCLGCSRPGNAICQRCLLLIPYSIDTENEGIYGLYNYGNTLVSESIWSLKYYHRGQGAKILTQNATPLINEILAEHLHSANKEKVSLVPIPQYKKKTQTRGFNQSEMLAKWINEVLPNSKIEKILEKTKQTKPQSHLSNRQQRLNNVLGVMKLRDEAKVDKDRLYIIVDDVTTTGATFIEARRALSSIGARSVLCIALAHGYKKR